MPFHFESHSECPCAFQIKLGLGLLHVAFNATFNNI